VKPSSGSAATGAEIGGQVGSRVGQQVGRVVGGALGAVGSTAGTAVSRVWPNDRPPVPVLCYHRVDTSGDTYSTTPEVFGRHLDWMAEHGYRTVIPTDLERALTDPEAPALPARSILLTFDDGFACLESEVAPALQARGFTGVSFVITGRVGDPGCLSWEGARSLDGDGVLEIHSHSHSHEIWPLEAASVDTVAEDLARSRDELASNLDRDPATLTHLAWPYGRACSAWETAADRLGLRVHYVVQRGAVDRRDQTRRLPRLLADGMAPPTLATWLRALSAPPGARLTNQVFGSIRQVRQGAAYR
jgi:peptidoglycan/xylan/chitin deacetylase (PgdA/CDA1 family)